MATELRAQIVEELSILNAQGYATKEPRRIPRPDSWHRRIDPLSLAAPIADSAHANAINRLLASALPPPRRGGGGSG